MPPHRILHTPVSLSPESPLFIKSSACVRLPARPSLGMARLSSGGDAGEGSCVGAGDTGQSLPCLPTPAALPGGLLRLQPHHSALPRSCLPSPSESTSPGPGEGSLQNCLAGTWGPCRSTLGTEAHPNVSLGLHLQLLAWNRSLLSKGHSLHVDPQSSVSAPQERALGVTQRGWQACHCALWKVLEEPGGWMVSPARSAVGQPRGTKGPHLLCSLPRVGPDPIHGW